jgi:hypothetical protein
LVLGSSEQEAVTTASGLVIQQTKAGTGASPTADSTVRLGTSAGKYSRYRNRCAGLRGAAVYYVPKHWTRSPAVGGQYE